MCFFKRTRQTSNSLRLTRAPRLLSLRRSCTVSNPRQIAKTICLRVGDKTLLIVASGIARLDNRKVKDVLGGKGRMLDPEQVLAVTGHPVGGVCPFGLLSPLPVYCDISLRRFKEVVPAAGSGTAALKIATERLVELTSAIWVDVCR